MIFSVLKNDLFIAEMGLSGKTESGMNNTNTCR